jgi:hypothetical protein
VTTPESATHVLAAEYVVPDLEGLWSQMTRYEAQLESMGARHVVVYTGLRDPHRVFVTIGIRHRRPLEAVLRSPEVFAWFDAAGVENLPPLFAGVAVEKIQVQDDHEDPEADHAGVVVGGIVPVSDVDGLRRQFHEGLEAFRRSGVRKTWIYQAMDDTHEVMILQEIDSEEHAARWIDHSDVGARWMAAAGVGIYPPLFVGRMERMLNLAGSEQEV